MDTFTLEISVTEKCNLGCPYCYVANKNTFLSEEVFEKNIPTIKDLMSRSNTKKLHVSFFGGEPMINFDIIKYITIRLREEFGESLTDLVILSNMTLLDEEKLQWIKEHDVRCSWSFDGISSNISRPLLPFLENKDENGHQYKNIMEMYDKNIHLIKQITKGCKTMIWPGNMSEMVENYKYFIKIGISPDFSLVRDDVWTRQDIIDFRKYAIELFDEYKQTIIEGRYQVIGFHSLYLKDITNALIKGKRPFGCFAGTRGAVLMSSGEFYPCARFASKKINIIDENYSFNYWDKQFKPINYDKCKDCDIVLSCNAGCNYSQLRNDNKPLDSVCELFHILTEQTMRITDELKDNKNYKKLVVNLLKSLNEN